MSNIINFGGGATSIPTPFKPEGKSYLTFSSPNSFTLAVKDATKHWDGTLEYFASNKTWTVWAGTTTLSAVDNDGEYVLYLRGTGNTKIGYYNGNNYIPWTISGTDVRCNGNIEILLDYVTVEAGQHPTMAEQDCFSGLFMDCTSLTQAPALPATTLANYCYCKMFYGCNKYPDCDFVLWNEPTGEKCPDCGSLLVKKVLKKGTFLECSSKTCKYSKEVEENV